MKDGPSSLSPYSNYPRLPALGALGSGLAECLIAGLDWHVPPPLPAAATMRAWMSSSMSDKCGALPISKSTTTCFENLKFRFEPSNARIPLWIAHAIVMHPILPMACHASWSCMAISNLSKSGRKMNLGPNAVHPTRLNWRVQSTTLSSVIGNISTLVLTRFARAISSCFW